jgi:hypothetical protein
MFDRFPEGWSAERYRIWLAPAQRPLADRDVVVLVDLSFQVYTPGHRRPLSACSSKRRVASSPAISFMTAR